MPFVGRRLAFQAKNLVPNVSSVVVETAVKQSSLSYDIFDHLRKQNKKEPHFIHET